MCMAGIQAAPLVGSGVTVEAGPSAALIKAREASSDVANVTGASGWDAKKAAYVGSDLQTLAKKSWAGSAYYDQAVSHFGSATWLDDYVLSALEASGEFATTLDTARGDMAEARSEAFAKAMQDQILVTAAISALQSGPTDAANWRLMYAYWTGANPSKAPWARANKRCKNYGTCGGMTSGSGGELANVRARRRTLRHRPLRTLLLGRAHPTPPPTPPLPVQANSNILLATVHATQAINNGLASSAAAHADTAYGNAMIVYYQAALLVASGLLLAPSLCGHGRPERGALGLGRCTYSRGAPRPLRPAVP